MGSPLNCVTTCVDGADGLCELKLTSGLLQLLLLYEWREMLIFGSSNRQQPAMRYTQGSIVQENSIFVKIFKQNSTMKHFIDTLERLKIKFSFLPTHRKINIKIEYKFHFSFNFLNISSILETIFFSWPSIFFQLIFQEFSFQSFYFYQDFQQWILLKML